MVPWPAILSSLQPTFGIHQPTHPQAVKLKTAQDTAAAETAEWAAEVGMARRDLALKLQAARRRDTRLSMTNQFKQSMAAPDWEIDDYEWCEPLSL